MDTSWDAEPAKPLVDGCTGTSGDQWAHARTMLAFQGNIRAWPDADAAVVRDALEKAAGESAAGPSLA